MKRAILVAMLTLSGLASLGAANAATVLAKAPALACNEIAPFYNVAALVEKTDIVNLTLYANMLVGAHDCLWLSAGSKVHIVGAHDKLPLTQISRKGKLLYVLTPFIVE